MKWRPQRLTWCFEREYFFMKTLMFKFNFFDQYGLRDNLHV